MNTGKKKKNEDKLYSIKYVSTHGLGKKVSTNILENAVYKNAGQPSLTGYAPIP